MGSERHALVYSPVQCRHIEAFAQSCSLHWRCSFVTKVSLACLCSRCFWRRCCRLHSWDSGVFSFTPFIAVVSNKLQEGDCTRKKFNTWKCLISKRAHAHKVWFVLGLQSINQSINQSFIKNREVLVPSPWGEGKFICYMDRSIDRQTDSQIDRQTVRQTDRQIDR